MNIDFQNLPDYPSKEELRQYFQEVLDNVATMDTDSVIDALWELADRQWHTYSHLDSRIKVQVDEYIKGLLTELDWGNKGSARIMRRILGTIGNLGLPESYAQLLSMQDNEAINKEVLAEIERLLDQIRRHGGNQIIDPYFDAGSKPEE